MSNVKAFLEKGHIENFLSLRDVTLPLKPLTVLVGPNASGKSNVLSALNLFNVMMIAERLPPVEFIQDHLWAGVANHITFRLQARVEETPVLYDLALKAADDKLSVDEKLLVKAVQVISTKNGEGVVQDENSENQTTYKSNKLALKSAGDYGHKPITNALTEFIKSWDFYDFQPDLIRGQVKGFPFVVEKTLSGKSKGISESPQLDDYGSTLSTLLSYWYKNAPELFFNVSKSLASSTNISIDYCPIDDEHQLCLLEGYKNPIPVERASDGTLRLVAYYILLNQPELPPFIAIEEPERSLHPGVLTDIAYVLGQLAERTQVIITTHSSQLLDAFEPKELSNSLGILLLSNRPGRGTKVDNLEDVLRRDESAALDDWIADFGIGSAIFDSELLQDLVEDPTC